MAFRNILLASAGALALSTLASGTFAATLNASAVSSVTVVSQTTLTKTQDMAFGTVVRPSSSSVNTTFTLDTNNTVTKGAAGDGSVLATTPSTSAKFSLVTTPGIAFTPSAVLSFAPAGLINVAAGVPAITGATGTGPTFNLAANGTAVLTYGGQFDVTPTTTAQTYTGTLALTINYN
jgi:hypothetical protein